MSAADGAIRQFPTIKSGRVETIGGTHSPYHGHARFQAIGRSHVGPVQDQECVTKHLSLFPGCLDRSW